MLFKNLRVGTDRKGRCLWRRSRQTLPAMRRKHTCNVHERSKSWVCTFQKKKFVRLHFSGNANQMYCCWMQKRTFFFKLTDSRPCVFTLRIADKVCLDWRHKRGRGSQPPKQRYLFFFTYKSLQTITNKIVLLFINIYTLMFENNIYIFPGDFNNNLNYNAPVPDIAVQRCMTSLLETWEKLLG